MNVREFYADTPVSFLFAEPSFAATKSKMVEVINELKVFGGAFTVEQEAMRIHLPGGIRIYFRAIYDKHDAFRLSGLAFKQVFVSPIIPDELEARLRILERSA